MNEMLEEVSIFRIFCGRLILVILLLQQYLLILYSYELVYIINDVMYLYLIRVLLIILLYTKNKKPNLQNHFVSCYFMYEDKILAIGV